MKQSLTMRSPEILARWRAVRRFGGQLVMVDLHREAFVAEADGVPRQRVDQVQLTVFASCMARIGATASGRLSFPGDPDLRVHLLVRSA